MWGYNTTYHADPDELLGVVEARLQQLREVVVLGGADESGDGEAVEGARARVQVRQQDAERLAVELDHAELQTSGVSGGTCTRMSLSLTNLCLSQLDPVHLLGVGAHAQPGHSQLRDVVVVP